MTKHAWAVLVCMAIAGCGAGPSGGGGGARPSPTPSYYPPPGGGGTLPGPTPGPSTAPVPGPSVAPSPSAAVVMVQNFQFTPATVTVAPGSVVTWRFLDAVAHTSTSTPGSGESWDSGLLANGQSYSHQFNQAGRFAYLCLPHPYMTGTVVVQ